ncbi:unnamed protein product [Urochloa humidicola]
MPTSTVVITMDLSCCRCRSKIEKILCKLEERCKFVFEKVVYEKDKVRITGPFDATDLICKLRCKAGCFVRNIVIELPPPPPPPKCCEKDPKCCKKEPKKKKCNDTPPTNIVVNVENPKQPDPTPCDTKVLFPFPYPFPCPYPYLQPACKLPWPVSAPHAASRRRRHRYVIPSLHRCVRRIHVRHRHHVHRIHVRHHVRHVHRIHVRQNAGRRTRARPGHHARVTAAAATCRTTAARTTAAPALSCNKLPTTAASGRLPACLLQADREDHTLLLMHVFAPPSDVSLHKAGECFLSL